MIERGAYGSFGQLKTTFASVDKVGERFVFNIGGNKYRLIVTIAFQAQLVWSTAVHTHEQYDKEDWK